MPQTEKMDSLKVSGGVAFTAAIMHRIIGIYDPYDPFDRIVEHVADFLIKQVPRENLLEFARSVAVKFFSDSQSELMAFSNNFVSFKKYLSSDSMTGSRKRCADFFVQLVQDRVERKQSDTEDCFENRQEKLREDISRLLRNLNDGILQR